MTTLKRFALPLVFACAAASVAVAQTPTPTAGPEAKGPIALSVVVTPSETGAPVPGLPESAFTLLDNGKPVPIQSFHAVTAGQEPLKIILVIDDVNISYERLAYARSEVEHFLRANDGQLPAPTALGLVTDTSTELTPGFTKDGNALSHTLESKEIGLRDLRRSSGFYGAADRLNISLRALGGMVERANQIPGRKLILWVSPGWPLLSGPGVQLSNKEVQDIFHQVIGINTTMLRADVTLYAVDPLGAGQGPLRTFFYQQFVKGIRKPEQAELGDLGLQVLAEQSGGLAVNSSNDVSALLRRCADDTKAYYEITFSPPPADGPDEYHKLEVKVAGPHLVARTRQGYYGQP